MRLRIEPAFVALAGMGAACTSILGVENVEYAGGGDAGDAAATGNDAATGSDAAINGDAPPDSPASGTVVSLSTGMRATSVATDDAHVSWWSPDDHTIYAGTRQVPSALQSIPRSGQIVHALTTADGLYWIEDGPDTDGAPSSRVMQLPSGGDVRTVIDSPDALGALAITSLGVYALCAQRQGFWSVATSPRLRAARRPAPPRRWRAGGGARSRSPRPARSSTGQTSPTTRSCGARSPSLRRRRSSRTARGGPTRSRRTRRGSTGRPTWASAGSCRK